MTTTARKTRLVLVGCASQKLGRRAPARDLYVSDLFRKASAYAQAIAGPEGWFVLSAEHGLVKPDEELEPYDTKLGTKGGPPIHTWAKNAADQLLEEIHRRGLHHADVELVLLAGAQYGTILSYLGGVLLGNATAPLEGLGVGQRKSWLKAQLEDLGAPAYATSAAAKRAPAKVARAVVHYQGYYLAKAAGYPCQGDGFAGLTTTAERDRITCPACLEYLAELDKPAPATEVVEAPAVVELEELAVTDELRREVYEAGHKVTEASRSAAGGNRDLTVDRLLATALEAERQLEDLKAKLVLELRAGGASWTAIAGRLGVSKQAAAKRYGPLEWEALRTDLRAAR